MSALRFHPPDVRLTWWDLLRDGFRAAEVPPRAEGVEYGFLDRVVDRTSRELVERVEVVEILGGDLVHVATVAALPDAPEARREVCGELTRRLRFGQVHPDGHQIPYSFRWIEFRPGPAATLRIIARLVQRVDPTLPAYVELSAGPTGGSRLGHSSR